MTLQEFSRDIVPILGLISIVFVGWQLRQTTKWNKYNFTYNLINTTESLKLEYKIFDLLESEGIHLQFEKVDEVILKTIKENNEINYAILDYLNLLEQFCIGVKFKAVSKEMAFELFSEYVVDAWHKYKLYIEWHREDCKELFSELEKSAVKWTKKCK